MKQVFIGPCVFKKGPPNLWPEQYDIKTGSTQFDHIAAIAINADYLAGLSHNATHCRPCERSGQAAVPWRFAVRSSDLLLCCHTCGSGQGGAADVGERNRINAPYTAA